MADGTCQMCSKYADLRPYGPNGESICFDCGELDPKGTEARMIRRFDPLIQSGRSIAFTDHGPMLLDDVPHELPVAAVMGELGDFTSGAGEA